jgi:hypothetical protein
MSQWVGGPESRIAGQPESCDGGADVALIRVNDAVRVLGLSPKSPLLYLLNGSKNRAHFAGSGSH